MKSKKFLLGREYLSVYKLISGFIFNFFAPPSPARFARLLSLLIGRGKNLCFFLSFVKREGDFETFVSKSEEKFKGSSNNYIKSLARLRYRYGVALPLLKGENCGSADFLNYKQISGFIFAFFHAVIPVKTGIHFNNFNVDSCFRRNDDVFIPNFKFNCFGLVKIVKSLRMQRPILCMEEVL